MSSIYYRKTLHGKYETTLKNNVSTFKNAPTSDTEHTVPKKTSAFQYSRRVPKWFRPSSFPTNRI